MATTLVAVPSRLGDLELSKAVVGVADSIVDALPDRQTTERLVETLAASVATRAGRRRVRGIRGFLGAHPRLGVGLGAALIAAVVLVLVRRSRRRVERSQPVEVPVAA